jgi:enolase
MTKTTVTDFKLIGREILSSYAAFTIEGEMSARVQRDGDSDSWTIVERNGIPKGTSDGEEEAIYIPNDEAIKSIEENIVPLLPKDVKITGPQDILDAVEKFDLKLVEGAGRNKKVWGGNACLAASTCLFQTLLKASGYRAWEVLIPKGGFETFYFPNIAFNMVCGGEHVPGTKQDIQEMFFFTMKEESIKEVFKTGVKFFKQFEKNLAADGKPTGTAKERGFSFPVEDNFEGLIRIRECAAQLKRERERELKDFEWAIGTDNAFSELQKTDALRVRALYDFRFSGQGIKTREELIDFNGTIVDRNLPNFISMEDPGSENDVKAHRMMTEKYGYKIQVVIDDAAVTQMRFIIPFLASPERKNRAGNSILIKLNQAGTFTETCLATEIVLGLADVKRVKKFLEARKELNGVNEELKKLGINSLQEALDNIKKGGFTAFFSHRSTEGSSEFLPYMPLMYGAVSRKIWFKAGAPNGERNLQNYNPLIRAEEEIRERGGINIVVTGWGGLPDEVIAGRGLEID